MALPLTSQTVRSYGFDVPPAVADPTASRPRAPRWWGLRRDARFVAAALRPVSAGGTDLPPLPPGRHLPLPGRGTTFVRELSGPTGRTPVVLLHGWTMTADLNYHRVYDLLAREHPLVAMDARSHGRGIRGTRFTYDDAADDLVALLDTLGLDRAILAGFSLGGVTAMATALRHPDRVAGIVPQACALTYASLPRDRAVHRSLRAVEGLAEHPVCARLSRRYWHDTIRRHPDLLPYWSWLSAELATTSTREMLEVIDAVFATDLRGEAAALRGTPSAFVVLERDRVCRPDLQRAAAEAIGASVVAVPADHNLALTRPHQYGDALLAALAHVRDRIG